MDLHSVTLHDNMDISRLMVHAQQAEDSRPRKKNRENNKSGSFKSSSSMNRLNVQDKIKFKNRFSN